MIVLKPYTEYRDSGVDWLDVVPAHWQTLRAKYLLTETNDRAWDADLELLSLSKTRGILPQRELSDRIASASDFSQYKRVRPGQLVMNRMQAWNGLFGASPIEGMISPDYAVFNVRKSRGSLGYLLRLVRDPIWIQQFASLSTGVGTGFNRLYGEDLGRVPFLVPPLDEQRAIADFLDAMDARITRFLAARRRMIALLDEQKQAVINQAVTRGLDPDVPLKDSGVDWLGEIPAHWEARRIKTVAQETDARTTTGEEALLSLRMREGLILHTSVSDKPISPDALIGYKVVRPGQLVMNRMRASIGVFGLALTHGLVSPDYALFDISPDASAEFLLRVLKTPMIGDEFRRASSGLGTGHSGFLRLYSDDFRRVRIPVPPYEEQRRISEYIDQATARIDETIARSRREIDLVQEYRTRLISDVVTGKLDVRGVVLPAVEEIIGEEIEAAMEDEPADALEEIEA